MSDFRILFLSLKKFIIPHKSHYIHTVVARKMEQNLKLNIL